MVYAVERDQELVADALTFPVDALTRKDLLHVTLQQYPQKDEEALTVTVTALPGSRVSLAGTHWASYSMQAGNDLTHSKASSTSRLTLVGVVKKHCTTRNCLSFLINVTKITNTVYVTVSYCLSPATDLTSDVGEVVRREPSSGAATRASPTAAVGVGGGPTGGGAPPTSRHTWS